MIDESNGEVWHGFNVEAQMEELRRQAQAEQAFFFCQGFVSGAFVMIFL